MAPSSERAAFAHVAWIDPDGDHALGVRPVSNEAHQLPVSPTADLRSLGRRNGHGKFQLERAGNFHRPAAYRASCPVLTRQNRPTLRRLAGPAFLPRPRAMPQGGVPRGRSTRNDQLNEIARPRPLPPCRRRALYSCPNPSSHPRDNDCFGTTLPRSCGGLVCIMNRRSRCCVASCCDLAHPSRWCWH